MANKTGKGGFQKGQSGNPDGARLHRRTSSELDVRELARRFNRSSIATAASIMHNRDNAPSVRLAAADLLLNRGNGRPIQPHSDADGKPLNFGEMSLEQLAEGLNKLNAMLGIPPASKEEIQRTAH